MPTGTPEPAVYCDCISQKLKFTAGNVICHLRYGMACIICCVSCQSWMNFAILEQRADCGHINSVKVFQAEPAVIICDYGIVDTAFSSQHATTSRLHTLSCNAYIVLTSIAYSVRRCAPDLSSMTISGTSAPSSKSTSTVEARSCSLT